MKITRIILCAGFLLFYAVGQMAFADDTWTLVPNTDTNHNISYKVRASAGTLKYTGTANSVKQYTYSGTLTVSWYDCWGSYNNYYYDPLQSAGSGDFIQKTPGSTSSVHEAGHTKIIANRSFNFTYGGEKYLFIPTIQGSSKTITTDFNFQIVGMFYFDADSKTVYFTDRIMLISENYACSSSEIMGGGKGHYISVPNHKIDYSTGLGTAVCTESSPVNYYNGGSKPVVYTFIKEPDICDASKTYLTLQYSTENAAVESVYKDSITATGGVGILPAYDGNSVKISYWRIAATAAGSLPNAVITTAYYVDSDTTSSGSGLLTAGTHTLHVVFQNQWKQSEEIAVTYIYDNTAPEYTAPVSDTYDEMNLSVEDAGEDQTGLDMTDCWYSFSYSETKSVPALSSFTEKTILQQPSQTLKLPSSVVSEGKNGYYYVLLHITDNAGNYNESVAGYLVNDTSVPVINTVSASLVLEGEVLYYTADFVCDDAYSSVHSLQLLSGSLCLTTWDTQSEYWSRNGNKYTVHMPVQKSLLGSTVTYSIKAADTRGNEETYSLGEQDLPPDIDYKVIFDKTSSTSTDGMNVLIVFNQTETTYLKVLQKFIIQRTNASVSLPDLSLSADGIPAELQAVGDSVSSSGWRKYTDGGTEKVCYVDHIPLAGGAGHKKWDYKLTAYFLNPGYESVIWPYQESTDAAVQLPNNEGWLTSYTINGISCPFMIYDLNGNAYGSSSFKVDKSGKVNISFQGHDYDRDDWTVTVARGVTTSYSNGNTSCRMEALCWDQGNNDLEYKYADGYALISQTVTLPLGINNDLLLRWTEGGDSGAVVSSTQVIVRLDYEAASGVMLTVSDTSGNGIGSSSSCIVCSPGQPLVLELTAADASTNLSAAAWDLGNGTSAEGASVNVTYTQSDTQDLCYCEYPVQVTIPGVTDVISLTVKVLDTQQGGLWTSEHWKGSHEVYNTIQIPSGMHITMNGCSVSLEGGIAAGYDQGFEVHGSLAVKDGTSIAAADKTVKWGTIQVSDGGVLTAGGTSTPVVIKNARRGITADSGSIVTLTGVELSGNETGLQIFGGSHVSLNSCSIINNEIYGVKEERNAEPEIDSETEIKNNARNYYSWDKALRK